jgi:hypothetical protein
LNEVIGHVVRNGTALANAVEALDLPAEQADTFRKLLQAELRAPDVHNCARYRLTMKQTEQWTAVGRLNRTCNVNFWIPEHLIFPSVVS